MDIVEIAISKISAWQIMLLHQSFWKSFWASKKNQFSEKSSSFTFSKKIQPKEGEAKAFFFFFFFAKRERSWYQILMSSNY